MSLVKYSILPADFRFEVTVDPRYGMMYTNEMGLSHFSSYSVGYSSTWYNTLVGELRKKFCEQFHVTDDQIAVLSRYDADGSLVCWLRCKVRHATLRGPDAKKPLPPTDRPLTVEADVVDLDRVIKGPRVPRIDSPDHVIDL
jgi:hypothetical protein